MTKSAVVVGQHSERKARGLDKKGFRNAIVGPRLTRPVRAQEFASSTSEMVFANARWQAQTNVARWM